MYNHDTAVADAAPIPHVSPEEAARVRAEIRARFGGVIPDAVAVVLDPTSTCQVRLIEVERAVLLARTDLGDASDSVYFGETRRPGTYDSYDHSLTDFARWCAENARDMVPATEGALLGYLAHRAGDRCYANLATFLTAMNALHGALGIEARRATSSWVVRRMLLGIANVHGREPKRQARAFVVEYVRATRAWYRRLESVDPIRATRNFALISLGVATDLRASSLVAIRTEDNEIDERGIKLVVRHSKNRKSSEARHTIAIHRIADEDICPVAALERYAKAARLGPGPLFRGVTRGNVLMSTPMCTATVTKIVRQAIRATGLPLDESTFSSHSLRAGGITSAFERGMDVGAIMAVSDHTSVAQMFGYVRSEDPFKNNHTARLFGGLQQ